MARIAYGARAGQGDKPPLGVEFQPQRRIPTAMLGDGAASEDMQAAP